MQNKEEKGFLIFLTLILGGLLLYLFFDKKREETNRKKRIAKLRDRIDHGLEHDTRNLQSDWGNVYHDLDKSYDQLLSNI